MDIERLSSLQDTRSTLELLAGRDISVINEAIQFAYDYLGQKYRKLPFPTEKTHFEHSVEVAGLVAPFFEDDPEVIAIALLHDVIEDVSDENIYDDIKYSFGDRIADGVAGLSEDKRRGYLGRKLEYVDSLDGQLRTADELVVISLADKYVNVRDMNRTYETLISRTGDIRLATALHYGGFYGSPHEAERFYRRHYEVVNSRIGDNNSFTELMDQYQNELASWFNIFTPPETYQRQVDADDSTRIRRLCWKLCYALNNDLKAANADIAIAIAGSVAYGAGVRINNDDTKNLNNVNFILYNPKTLQPISREIREIDQLISQEPFISTFAQIDSQVRAYCGNPKNIISITSSKKLIQVHGDFYATPRANVAI